MPKALRPNAFTVFFAFAVTAVTLIYMTTDAQGFYTCGLPFQFVTQLPEDGTRVSFSLAYHWMFVDLAIWYLVGVALYENTLDLLGLRKQ